MIDASDLERFGIPQPDNTHPASESDYVPEPHAGGFSQTPPAKNLVASPDAGLDDSGRRAPSGVFQPLTTKWNFPDTAIPASEGNQGLRQCVSPCKQLVALYATVERLEDIVFRIQREVAGMECLLAGLEARR